jgi:hypothetical protein
MRQSLPIRIFTLLITLAFSYCATLDVKDIPSSAETIAFEPQKIEIGYDVTLLRIDLQRQYTTQSQTVTTTDAQGKTHTTVKQVQVAVPYHYLGVDMGNGIFLDANMNLSLSLHKLLGLRNDQNFTIVRHGRGLFSADATFSKRGNQLTIDYGGLFSSPTEIEFTTQGAHFKGGILSADQDIIVEKNRITYDPHGLFDGWSKSYITAVGSSAQIPGFWKDTAINKNKDGSINLGESLVVRHEGKRIIFRYAGWFGSEHIYTMVRSQNRIVYYDENMNGVLIELTDKGAKTKTAGGETEYTISTN